MYRYFDAAVVRAPTWPVAQQIPWWPDLTRPEAGCESWRAWLTQVWQMAEFAAAVELANPGLTRRVGEICDGRNLPEPVVRRAVLAVMRYLLRASTRATPFGLFAGVAPARISTRAEAPIVHVGREHRPVARVTAEWFAAVLQQLEGVAALRERLTVVATDLLIERDGLLVLEHHAAEEDGGAPAHVRVRATGPVRAALRLAREPVPVRKLVDTLGARFPGVPGTVVDGLVADLVRRRLLLTNLRPPMTVVDPLGHLVRALNATGAEDIGEVSDTIKRLCAIAEEVAQHNDGPTTAAVQHRARAAAEMAAILPTPRRFPLAFDLRLDWQVTVPAAVAAEAASAAGALTRLARRPALHAGWVAWHERFLARYDLRALVPVLDAVDDDIGVGYPAGYGGPAIVADDALTDRDSKLLVLAHNAAIRRRREVLLDDSMIAELGGAAAKAPIQPTTELTVRIDATTADAVAEGRFTLVVTGVSRAAGTTTGRFLDMFDSDSGQRMSALYADLPTGTHGALSVQISAPAPYAVTENVARVSRVLAHVLPVGEPPPAPDGGVRQVAVDDIAVAADRNGIYLVSRSLRRPIEPVAFNAVNPILHTHPLARFLMEAPQALRAPCTGFDWGAAAALPFLPALRYGRTVISPARWRLTAADLPASSAGWQEWDDALGRWRQEAGLPATVCLGGGDQHIRLDLSLDAHRVLLRAQLARAGNAVLSEAPAAEAAGWIGGHPHEVVVPLTATARPADPPQLARTAVLRGHGHLPGGPEWLSFKVYGHPDRQTAILTGHLPRLIGRLGDGTRWWFLRYHDPDHHVRIRLRLPAGAFTRTATLVHAWSEELGQAGLTALVRWDTYFPQSARFGGGDALAAAETFFAADSAAALAQLAAAAAPAGPGLRAVTGASLLDIAIAFLGDPAQAMAWLITHTRADTSAPARHLYDQAVSLANPGDRTALAMLHGGQEVVSCWEERAQALATYRRALEASGELPATVVLPDLLHLHHVRVADTSQTGERACLHLARAAALSWTTRARRHL